MSWKIALPVALALLVAAPSTFAEDSRPAPSRETLANCEARHLQCAEECGKKHYGEFLNACLVECSNARNFCKNFLTRRDPRDRAPSRPKDKTRDAG